ncbi:MAG TPA: hypothetical protein VGD74_02320, partial [Vulgatibacter sp.]
MSRITLELRGLEDLQRRLGLAQEALTKGVAAGLYAVGQNIRSTSMDKTPIDTGSLKSSHYVTEPEGLERAMPSVTIGCGGGPAQPYAIVQHERLDLRHPEGEAKFLEKAATEE